MAYTTTPLFPLFKEPTSNGLQLYQSLQSGRKAPSQAWDYYETNGLLLYSECSFLGVEFHLSEDQKGDLFLNDWKIGTMPQRLLDNGYQDTVQFAMLKVKAFISKSQRLIFKSDKGSSLTLKQPTS